MPLFVRKIKEYFNFNRTEQRGIILLLVLLLAIIALNLSLPAFFKSEPEDFSDFLKEVREFKKSKVVDTTNRISGLYNVEKNQDSLTQNDFFKFDPNRLPEEEWKRLGLSEQQISVIKNYEAKGGSFKKPDDLAKIYSINDEEFDRLKPWIVIHKTTGKKALKPFPFDPNIVSRDSLLKMGLEEGIVQTIINYREKGGQFRKVEDLNKIYGLSEDDYQSLQPFVTISEDTILEKLPVAEKKLTIIELNDADTLDLQQLKGIGPSFAARIVKYRDLLGGYYSPDQLFEVYGMDSARYNGFAAQVRVDPDKVNKININTATVKDLIRHPYIEYYLAKSIITHRSEIGRYSSLEELMDAKLIYRELYDKIVPYLAVNDGVN